MYWPPNEHFAELVRCRTVYMGREYTGTPALPCAPPSLGKAFASFETGFVTVERPSHLHKWKVCLHSFKIIPVWSENCRCRPCHRCPATASATRPFWNNLCLPGKQLLPPGPCAPPCPAACVGSALLSSSKRDPSVQENGCFSFSN